MWLREAAQRLHKICWGIIFAKGGFYSEGTDAFVISSNKWTLLFSWPWILNLWNSEISNIESSEIWKFEFKTSTSLSFSYGKVLPTHFFSLCFTSLVTFSFLYFWSTFSFASFDSQGIARQNPREADSLTHFLTCPVESNADLYILICDEDGK